MLTATGWKVKLVIELGFILGSANAVFFQSLDYTRQTIYLILLTISIVGAWSSIIGWSQSQSISKEESEKQ